MLYCLILKSVGELLESLFLMLDLSGAILLALLVHFIIVQCFLIPMDLLDGCISSL